MKRPLYMIVTRGKFEIPIAVGDNMADLAKQTGMKPESLYKLFTRCRKTGFQRGTAKEVWVDFSEKEWRELHEEQKGG